MKKALLHLLKLENRAYSFIIHTLEAVLANALLVIMYIHINIQNGQSAYITCEVSKIALAHVFLSLLITIGSGLLLDCAIKEQKQKEG